MAEGSKFGMTRKNRSHEKEEEISVSEEAKAVAVKKADA